MDNPWVLVWAGGALGYFGRTFFHIIITDYERDKELLVLDCLVAALEAALWPLLPAKYVVEDLISWVEARWHRACNDPECHCKDVERKEL